MRKSAFLHSAALYFPVRFTSGIALRRDRSAGPRGFKGGALLAVLLATTTASAQQPGVFVKLDLYPTFLTGKGENNEVRFYDVLGHYSTVGFSLNFEEGYRAFACERLQKLSNTADDEQLDQYYVEDPGIWRLGKQYLPFGRGNLLREDALAANAQSRLLFRGLPISVAVCDSGARKAQGVTGRVGGGLGVSFAIGHNFGAEPTDFDVVRRPEDAPGAGRGYRTILGADYGRHLGMYNFDAEFAALRSGETSADHDTEISDLSVTLLQNRYKSFTLGWSRNWGQANDFYRAQAQIFLTKDVWLEPIVRFRDSEFYDFGATLHVRL